MSGIDIFALIVLLVILATVVAVIVFLGLWPAKIAASRNHPQLEAITVGSWIALIVGGVLWPLILIWAYAKPLPRTATTTVDDTVQQADIQALEKRLMQLEQKLSRNGGEA